MSEFTDARKVGIEMMRTKALRIIEELYDESDDSPAMKLLLTAYNRINTTPMEEEKVL
jgi:hypothetical protein